MAAVPSIGRAAGVEREAPVAGATHDLYERYSAQIFGFCFNRLGSREEAEDATQSTFLNAHRALQRGVTPEAELAWLFKIAHNVCLTRRRSWRRRNRVESPSDLDAVQDVLPAPTRESADELIRLQDALAHMPDNQRRAILLREWQGLSYHEIAADLKVTQSAVETLIFRARRALAANLQVDRPGTPVFARLRKAFDVATLVAAVKTLFVTSTAVKATAAVVAVTGAAVVATSPDIVSRPLTTSAPEPVSAVVSKAPAAPVAFVAPRHVTQVEQPVPVARAKAAPPPAKANAKANGANAEARTLPPGQAKKASALVPPKAKGPKPAWQRPAKATPKPKPVQPRATARSTPKPKVAKPMPAKSNAGGNGNGKGAGKNDG